MTYYLAVELNLIGESIPESPEPVSDQGVKIGVRKLVQMSLQIGLGRLGPGPDGHGSTIVIIRGWANLFKKLNFFNNLYW